MEERWWQLARDTEALKTRFVCIRESDAHAFESQYLYSADYGFSRNSVDRYYFVYNHPENQVFYKNDEPRSPHEVTTYLSTLLTTRDMILVIPAMSNAFTLWVITPDFNQNLNFLHMCAGRFNVYNSIMEFCNERYDSTE
jgi:hypothetical protein